MKSMTKEKALCLIGITLFVCFCQGRTQSTPETKGDEYMAIIMKSPAFEEGGMIPSRYTCDGNDISPRLAWEGIPDGTKSIALICDDPDAPMGTWVHWVIFNIHPEAIELPEGVPTQKKLENGSIQGTNDFRKIGYGGPCPPGGPHRYYFKLYALDTIIELDAGATKKQLLAAMEGHILAQGQLMGKYTRKK